MEACRSGVPTDHNSAFDEEEVRAEEPLSTLLTIRFQGQRQELPSENSSASLNSPSVKYPDINAKLEKLRKGIASRTNRRDAIASIVSENLPFSGLNDGGFSSVLESIRSNHSRKISSLHSILKPRHMRARNHLRGFVLRKIRLEAKAQFPGVVNPAFFSAMLSLPSDLCFEIFAHLHPLDLYHLCLTTKTLHSLLTSPAAAHVWKQSFSEHQAQIPDCPTGFSRLKWVSFLFGAIICECCGSPWANLHFGILKKLCEPCSRKVLFDDNFAMDLCDAHEHPIDYGTVFSACVESHPSRVHFSPKAHSPPRGIFLLNEILDCIRLVCPQCNEHQWLALPEWAKVLSEKLEDILERKDHALDCQLWVESVFRAVKEFERDWYCKRYTKPLLKKGFEPADLKRRELTWHLESNTMLGLSRRYDLRDHLRVLAERAYRSRSNRLREPLQELLEETYALYRRGRPQTEWGQCPATSVVQDLPCFKEFFHDLGNPDKPQASTDLTAAVIMERLHYGLEDWRKRLQEGLYRQLSVWYSSKKKPLPNNVLNLAVSAFICSSCEKCTDDAPLFCGGDAVLYHACSFILTRTLDSERHRMQLSTTGRDAVLAVLRCLKLDPDTTTGRDLDKLDARFFCAICEPEPLGDGTSGRASLMWRECVTHVVNETKHDSSHRYPEWYLMTKTAAKILSGFEEPWPSLEAGVWACTHCGDHSSSTVAYSVAEQHVLEAHRMMYPERGRDIIHVPNLATISDRVPAIYPLNLGPFVCLICLERSEVVLFAAVKHVLRHVQRQHGLSKPVEGKAWDWVQPYHADGRD